MIHEVFAPGMHNRAYYHRYTDNNVDLCDVLSSFSYGQGKVGRTQSDHGTSPFANCPVIVCYGGAGLFDKHLASTIHCVDDEIISARCSGVSNADAPAL
jgi:hypothetical protein